MKWTRHLLTALLLGALVSAALGPISPRKVRREEQRLPASTPAEEVTAPVALLPPSTGAGDTPVPARWWFETTLRPASGTIRTARLEAAWWSRWPASPWDAPEARFSSPEADLSRGDVRVEVAGDANPGWAVLFVVAGDTRELADPWSADPRFQVEPGRGFGDGRDATGAVVPALVGARELVVRALDRDGAPVVDLVVDARVPPAGRLQRRQTDAAGRARFTAFPSGEAVVSWRQAERRTSRRGEETIAREIADGSPHLVTWGGGAESVLRIQRHPRVRVRLRIAGAPEDAWCPASYVHVDGAPGVGHTWDAALGFFLPVGAWTCRTDVFGAGSVTATTRRLAFDDDVVLEVPASLAPDVAWLDVQLPDRAGASESRDASAVEARRSGVGGGWAGVRASAPSRRILVPLPSGAYVLTGAQRSSVGVGISEPMPVEVAAGERRQVVLETAPASGLVLPPTDISVWNDKLALSEHTGLRSGVVEDEPFGFTLLSNRERTSTWWLHAGRWTLLRLADTGPGRRRHSRFEAKPGRTLRVRETSDGFRFEDD